VAILALLTGCGEGDVYTPVPASAEIPGTWISTDDDSHTATMEFSTDGSVVLSNVPALPLSTSQEGEELDWDHTVTTTGTWAEPQDMSSAYPSILVTLEGQEPPIAYGIHVGVMGEGAKMQLFLYWGNIDADNKLVFSRSKPE